MPIIDSYLKDIITIVLVSKDINGVETETETTGVKCRIEDTNELVKNESGQEVVASMKIFITPGTTITYHNKIKIGTKAGVATLTPDKLYSIKKLGKRQGFSANGDHWEVWL